MTTPAGWDGILDSDERILWQGRPDQAFHTKPGNLFQVVFGMFFTGFALFWISKASEMNSGFSAFGLIFVAAGVYMVFNAILGETLKRRQTHYTLTNRRAFIARNSPFKGKSLKSYPIEPDTVVEFQAGPPDTIIFASETHRSDKGRTYTVPIGFERIEGGTEVLRHIRAIQTKTTAIDNEAEA